MTVIRFPYILIFLGAVLMLLCILKFRTNQHISKDLFSKNSGKISLLLSFQQVLMVFFFAGYIIVLYSLVQKVLVASIFFIGVIFFFGALFVFLGTQLQTDMLSWIKSEHTNLVKTNRQLLQTEAVTIYALAYQAELRDQETGKHIERTVHYVNLLAEELSRLPKYQSYLTPVYIADLVKSAPLHDIGKVAIPDSILRKPGKLTAEEFEIMKKHCEYGTSVLKIADEKLSFQSFLKIAIQVVASHHEKWNGKGYPASLKGETIPLSGRLMAFADVYDALRSERCYKKSMSHEETVKIMVAERGEHFDPDLVDVFSRIEDKFHKISKELVG